MDGMVEENGGSGVAAVAVAVTGGKSPQSQASVIQPNNQQSVIQTPAAQTNVKANVVLVGKPGSVIHTTHQSLHSALQIKPEPNSAQMKMDSCSDDSLSDEENAKKRRDLLTRRPSYRKILNDLGGAEIAVIPAAALQSDGSLLMTNSGSGGSAIVQYTSTDGQFFVPEDQTRKREMRLMKNREAARECRRKKKEYIKCLENRVAVLENQNKALIDELKALKELYCKQKTE